ncbi:MAG: hypothetical protein MUO63_12650 [Desulfobulbaceae bacterium]|nr:hypothetical protein [Desulfobulbaceae bacterium]
MNWWKNLNSWLDKRSSVLSAWASLLAIVGIPLLLLGGYATWLQVKNYINRPDIVLHLDSPKNVRLRLFNISSVLMRDPQYSLALWDLNARQEGIGDDPGNLMIPTKSMSYIRPKSGIGPWAVKSLSDVSTKVPDGHFVFGWASVQCPDCVSRKHYWILIKKGEMAWYSVIGPEEQLSIMKNLSLVLNAGANFLSVISEIVPIEQRITVTADN